MMILWSCAGLPLAIHNILSGQHIALQIQAEVLTGLSLTTWGQCMYYGKVRVVRLILWTNGWTYEVEEYKTNQIKIIIGVYHWREYRNGH